MEKLTGFQFSLADARKNFLQKMLIVAIPVIFQNLISVGLNIIDTIMIGNLGEAELAAVGSANQIYMIYGSICFGLYSGTSVFVAQFWGIKDKTTIRKILGIDYLIGVSSSIITIIFVWIFAPQLISLFADYDGVIDLGSDYIRIACFSYFFMCLSFAISYNCRAIQKLIAPTSIAAMALIINTVLNYAMIYGHFGFEAMGVKGAAIATLIARIFEFLCMFLYVYTRKEHPFKARFKELFSFDRKLFRDVMKMALPVVATETLWAASVAITFMAYGKISYEALAVVQVAEVVSNFFQILFFGLGNATAVIIGESLGRGERDKAFYFGTLSLKITWLVNIIMTVTLFLLKEEVAMIYDFEAETNILLIKTLGVWAFTITPKMLAYVLICGVLRAGGDTLFSMIVDVFFNLGVQAPLAFFGVYVLKWPLYMIVGLVATGEVLKSAICYYRFYSKKWLNVVTKTEYN